MLEHLAEAAEEIRGTVVDAGANLGSYTLPLAKVYGGLEFACFEPQAPICELLLRNVAENGLTNVVAHRSALSDEDASMKALLPAYEREGNVGAFSLDREVLAHDYEVKTEGESAVMELRTLDSFGFDRVRMLKLDVEGMELAVLRGARATLERCGFPPILFEAWQWKPWYAERRRELIAWLEGLGYEVQTLGAFAHLAQHPRYAPVVAHRELVAGL